MKIAIYGGAFNPVHNEHVNIARAAVEALGLDKIFIVPTNISPHKGGCMTARAGDRLKMCRIAFAQIPQAEVDDLEIRRGGVSYSYVTCRRFKKLFRDDEIYFIMGGDMLKSFLSWKEPAEIMKCATLAVCRRGGEDISRDIRECGAKFNHEIIDFGYSGGDVSSTAVRTLAALGEDISDLVPKEIAKFIKERNLYCLPEVWGVKKLLTKERWEHTVRVALFAAANRKKFGVFEYDAIVAAALHDCAKYLGEDAEELKGFIPPDGVPAPVAHQYSGAYVAEHTFKIKDENILNAIRYHTSGRENMRPLEKLIFLADMLEEGRTFKGVDVLRRKFQKDADGCLYAALKEQLDYLESTGKPVYPLTRRAFEYIEEEQK